LKINDKKEDEQKKKEDEENEKPRKKQHEINTIKIYYPTYINDVENSREIR